MQLPRQVQLNPWRPWRRPRRLGWRRRRAELEWNDPGPEHLPGIEVPDVVLPTLIEWFGPVEEVGDDDPLPAEYHDDDCLLAWPHDGPCVLDDSER